MQNLVRFIAVIVFVSENVRAYSVRDLQRQHRELRIPSLETTMALMSQRDPMRMMPNQTPMVPYKVCLSVCLELHI
jgi:nitrate reductase cytochrome c-type subunit